MKTKHIAAATLALGISAWTLFAQDNDQPPPPPPDNGASADAGAAKDNTDQPPPPPRGHRPPPPIIAVLDANHDCVIDADEIANASKALLSLDKNGDGKLTRDEYMGPPPGPRPPQQARTSGTNSGSNDQEPPPPPPPGDGQGNGSQQKQGGHRPPPPIIAVLDANHDGVIDADEIANATKALLSLDKNGDGQLTPDEYLGRPPGPPPQEQNGQNGGQAQDGGSGVPQNPARQ